MIRCDPVSLVRAVRRAVLARPPATLAAGAAAGAAKRAPPRLRACRDVGALAAVGVVPPATPAEAPGLPPGEGTPTAMPTDGAVPDFAGLVGGTATGSPPLGGAADGFGLGDGPVLFGAPDAPFGPPGAEIPPPGTGHPPEIPPPIVTEVPEPSAFALLAVALLAVALLGRRARRRMTQATAA